MKPQFANVFNVSVNDNRSECSLSFYHMYMQHNYTPQPKGLIDMPEKTVGEVASIMLTRDGAHALTRLLIQSFGLPEDIPELEEEFAPGSRGRNTSCSLSPRTREHWSRWSSTARSTGSAACGCAPPPCGAR